MGANAHIRKIGTRPAKQSQEPTRRLGGRSARVRADVLEAAFQLVVERGFANFSVGEVATRSGVHETSIYRRWQTKTLLLLDACLSFADEAIPLPDTGALRSDLIILLKSVRHALHSSAGHVLVALVAVQEAEAIAVRKAYWDMRLAKAAAIVERAKERGEISADTNAVQLLEALIAPLHFRRLVSHARLDDWPIETMVDRSIDSGRPKTKRRGGG